MSPPRRIAIGLAGLVAAPGVLLAVAACLYIVYSIATEEWYRQWFLGYGLMLAGLYGLFVAGVIAAALLSTGHAQRRGGAFEGAVRLLLVAGLAAACLLEFELWDEAERVLPFGLLFGPFAAWLLAWAWLRRSPPPAPEWEDTRT